MQTIFDAGTRDELLRRLDTIQPGSQRQWGKMCGTDARTHGPRAGNGHWTEAVDLRARRRR
jgi:hypothetical protein